MRRAARGGARDRGDSASRPRSSARSALVRNGAVADVAAILHQVPVNRVHELVRLSLRGGDGAAQADRAEYPPAGGDDLRAFAAGAGVEHFSGQPCGGIETADRISLTVGVGVAAGRHYDAERRARVPTSGGGVQRTGERRLAQVDQIALQAHQNGLSLRIAESAIELE